MTAENWQKSGLVDCWSTANGSVQWPFGDNWRLALINPVVLHVASLVQSQFDPKHKESLYRYIALQRRAEFQNSKSFEDMRRAFFDWHEHPFGSGVDEDTALSNLRLLDLGCGEAYRSRWLARFGASYLGIDCSAGLIAKAHERRETLSGNAKSIAEKHEYKTGNLENKSASDIARLCARFKPNLICAIASLDHIAKPQQLISAISEFSQNCETPIPILVVTLNPGHFQTKLARNPADTLDDKNSSYFGTLELATIQSAKNIAPSASSHSKDLGQLETAEHTADVYFRSLRDWEELFAQTFHVLHTAPLQFSDYTILAERPSQITAADVSYAIAPFCAWLLYPKRTGRPVTEKDLDAAMRLPGFLSKLNKEEKHEIRKQLSSQITKIRVIEYPENERIAFAHNMGGDTCVVMKGSAQLTADDGTSPQSFEVGDILGELENDWMDDVGLQDEQVAYTRRYMIRRYPYPVDSGSQTPVVLLVLPPNVFQKIANVAGMASFAGVLFRNLRDKLAVNMWQFYGERMKSEDAIRWDTLNTQKFGSEPDKKFPSAKLQLVAKGIMSVSSIEAYDTRRATDGTTIFCGPVEIARLLHLEESFVIRALALFDMVGLIRWIDAPLFESSGSGAGTLIEALKISAQAETDGNTPADSAQMKWEEWKAKAFRHLVARPIMQGQPQLKALEKIYKGVVGMQIKHRGFGIKKDKQFGLFEAAEVEFKSCVQLLGAAGIKSTETEALLRKYLANIGYVNLRIVRSMGTGERKTGRVIRLVAAHELRRLAFDENEFLRVFADRLDAFPEYKRGRDFASESFKQIRALRYVEVIESFLETAWSAGDCYMSGRNLEEKQDIQAFELAIQEWLLTGR